jgi:succinate dehydrogenase/fumarate reductase flavoprotein subunit
MNVDVLVVGSGGGGLIAALTAATAGRRVLIAEKLATVGGSTALSGGRYGSPTIR